MAQSLLREQAIAALKELRQRGERMIDSADVYERITAKGVTIPSGALGEVFTDLVDRGVIQVSPYMDMAGMARHGAMIITIVQL